MDFESETLQGRYIGKECADSCHAIALVTALGEGGCPAVIAEFALVALAATADLTWAAAIV